MILAGKVDLIAFTSVGEVDSLLFMLDEKRDALAKHTIACFGPVTADGARQRGVHADIVSEQYSSFEFFIEAMERYFAGCQVPRCGGIAREPAETRKIQSHQQ